MKDTIKNRKYRKLPLLLLLWCGIFFAACNSRNEVPAGGQVQTGEKQDVIPDEVLYEQLFDINNKIEIDLDITEEQLALLQEDYETYSAFGSKSPIYRNTPMTIRITTPEGTRTYEFENVGIRMKGNTSRTDFYNPEEGKYNLIHFKIEFPEKFAGLEKLDIRWNKLDDSTYIREYYSYEFMRACGLLAPRSNLASVSVAGVHEGVFSICEPVDKLFIERNLPEEDRGGDLYKCGWTWNGASYTSDMSVGIENEDNCEFFNFDLKTNKKKSDHAQINHLLTALNDGEVTKEELAELVDMEYFVKFAAASYFIGNPDDMRNNYNNHYIYFLKSSNKAVFIPCDNDRCFGITKEWNPTGDGMVSVNPFSTLADGNGNEQLNPLFIYTVDEDGYYIDEYTAALKEVAQSEWLTGEKFDSVYETACGNYKEDAKPDKNFYNAGEHRFRFDNQFSAGLGSTWNNASFEEYIEAKMRYFYEYISGHEVYSIRGTFNDWALREEYVMAYDADTNTYSYTLTLQTPQWMKIADSDGQNWYGYENIAGTVDASYITYDEGHYDIVLEPGTYRIAFHAEEKTIEINRENGGTN